MFGRLRGHLRSRLLDWEASLWFVVAGAVLVALAIYTLGWQRYQTFHNETFDLALYGRMAWGMVRGIFWDPVTNANTFGVHIMPILLPLGLVGGIFGTVRTLLVAQSVCLAATAVPLFVVAHKRLGTIAGLVVALLWWMYPHIFHVGTYEFHPGSLGVFFLACACAVDAIGEAVKPSRAWWVLLLLAVSCREDIALSAACLVVLRPGPRSHYWVAAAGVAYFLLFALVAVPLLGPVRNSVALHFGNWGDTLPEVAFHLLAHPGQLLAYVFSEARLIYLLQLVGFLAFLPLLGPRWLVPAFPFLGMNLISSWPSAIELDSHYQTLILPFLFLASIEGLARLRARSRTLSSAWLGLAIVASLAGHYAIGGSWLARDFETADFVADARAQSASRIVDQVPPTASVQAPYPLMPHLLERYWVAPAPPPDRNFDYVVLDLSARTSYRGDATVLRTDEEPFLRAWLGRDDYGIVAHAEPYALLARGAEARVWAKEAGYLLSQRSEHSGARLTACLGVLDATLRGDVVAIRFRAYGPCDKDLALRLGDTYRPRRVELLFDGVLNPAQLRAGDLVRSLHTLSPEERSGILDTGLCVGAVRQSGVRPDKQDPVSVCVPTND